MNIYEKILAIRKELPPFQFDRTAGDVKIISDEQMNKALVPLLDKYNIITIPHGEIIGDHFKLTVEFRSLPMEGEVAYKDEDDRMEAHMSWPIDKRNFEFGATATLADKYLSVILFKIKADVKSGDDQIRKEAFDPSTIKTVLLTSQEEMDHAILKQGVEIFEGMASKVIEEDPLKDLVDQVTKEEDLKPAEPIIKPEKKEPEPNQDLMEKINQGVMLIGDDGSQSGPFDWKLKIPLNKCTDELTAVKALDTMYMNVGTGLYGHLDNELCPVNPYKVIDQMARRSNLKIRRPIVQFRVFGEEAFWNQLEAETNLKKDEILAKLASPTIEPVKEETKKIIHELKLDFDIPEHMGVDRDEETTFRLLQNLLRIGVTKFTIIYALGKMGLMQVKEMRDDDRIILEFLAKGSLLQIEEMIKLAKGAG